MTECDLFSSYYNQKQSVYVKETIFIVQLAQNSATKIMHISQNLMHSYFYLDLFFILLYNYVCLLKGIFCLQTEFSFCRPCYLTVSQRGETVEIKFKRRTFSWKSTKSHPSRYSPLLRLTLSPLLSPTTLTKPRKTDL